MLTEYSAVVYAQIAVCACADGSGLLLLHKPHPSLQTAVQTSVQWECSRSTRTLLPDYWQVCQGTELASRFTRGSVASASACSACLLKHVMLSCWSFDNASLASSMAWGILLCAHSLAIQFWLILSLVVRTFSSPVPRVHSNRAHPRRVSMPSCNDTDYIRKWKIVFVVYSIIIIWCP